MFTNGNPQTTDAQAFYGPNYTDGGSLGSGIQNMLPVTGMTVVDTGPLHLTVGGLISVGILAVVVGFVLLATARRSRRAS